MMSVTTKKTYLLAPNFDFAPDGAIALGNILADPFEPHRPLTTLDTSKLHPEITSRIDYDCTFNQSSGRNISVGIWAQFVSTIGGNVGSQRGKEVNTEYKMQSLETIMFKTEPTDAMVTERLKDPLVRNIMQYNSAFCRPIYMITGIKVAKGLEATTEKLSVKGGSVGATVPVVEGIVVGANVDMLRGKGRTDSFRAGSDVVFAYKLLKVSVKGWREKNLAVDEFKSRQAFLSDSSDEEDDELLEADVSVATSSDISKDVTGSVTVAEISMKDGEGDFTEVVFKNV